MINLLPLEQKTRIRNEYLGRAAAISLFFLFSLVLISGALLVPVIVSSENTKSELAEKLTLIKTNIAKDADRSSAAIGDFRRKLSVLNKKTVAERTPSQIFEKIIFEKTTSSGGNVKINGFVYEKTSDKSGFMARVSGAASDRKNLLNFVKALQDDGGFKEVKVPVSDFARGENLEFSLEIII